jgi:hypothetical protein
MKNGLKAISAVVLFLMAATLINAQDQLNILRKNKHLFNKGGVYVSPTPITFIADGTPIEGWVFAKDADWISTIRMYQKNSSTGVLTQIGASISNTATWGQYIQFGTGIPAGTEIVVKLTVDVPEDVPHGIAAAHQDQYFSNDLVTDPRYYRLKAFDFPGYKNSTLSIPDGIWLGWEDICRDRTDWRAEMDYDDFAFIAQGFGPVGTIKQKVNMGRRLVIGSWKEENVFNPQ